MDSTELSNKEQAELFYRHFQNEVARLQEQMENLLHISEAGGERKDAIDYSAAGIQRLQHEVQDASSYLPAHDQRTYGDAVKALTDKLQKTRAVAAPKPKFTFKSSRKVVSPPPAEPSTAEPPVRFTETPAHEQDTSVDDGPYDLQLREESGPRIRKPSFTQAESISLTNHSHMHIILPASASHAMTTGNLSHITHCVIDISNPLKIRGTAFASLTIKHISDSLIITGDVAGPAHITGLENTTLVTSCRQFRMHDCKNVDVYLQCASRPIIEDCQGIRFAPLPQIYASEETKPATDQWDKVDDFKWLKAVKSPNWSVMPEGERVEEKVWRDTVPGSIEIGLKEIWGAVKPPAA